MTQLSQIIDPLSKREKKETRFWIVKYVDYLDRYSNMKIFQMQTTGDEFFLLDNEISYLQSFELKRKLFSKFW